MKPLKSSKSPMLDRVYLDLPNGRDNMLKWEQHMQDVYYGRNNYKYSGTPEQRTLYNALNSPNVYFDAGVLPEIKIQPQKDNAVYKVGYMIPNKQLRNSFYESIDEDVDPRMYINRLWELYKKSQKPSIKNVRNQIGILPLYLRIRGDNPDRPNYKPYSNTMYVSPEFTSEDIEAELAHAYLFYGTDFPRKYGWLNALSSLPGDIKINGKDGYERMGNHEFNAHKIIEPLFHDYLTNPEVNYSDTYEIMMDMYLNPNSYFKKYQPKIKPRQ